MERVTHLVRAFHAGGDEEHLCEVGDERELCHLEAEVGDCHVVREGAELVEAAERVVDVGRPRRVHEPEAADVVDPDHL